MTATEALVDRLIEGMDDSLNPIEAEDKATVDDTADEEDTKAEDTSKTDDTKSDDKADDTEDTTDEDEGFAIDDVSDSENTTEEEKKEEQEVRQELANLNPEQRYIVENIQPIKIRGVVGDGEEVKEFTVFSPEQLPGGFKYLDDREHDIAVKGFNSLETRARELQSEFQNKAQEDNSKKFKEANDRADWEDIAYLQSEKELPKFKIRPGEPGFEDDPAAKLIQEVLDFKDKRNAKYLEDYNTKGRPFRMIGFEEAFRMYKPTSKEDTTAQDKEDSERKNLSKRTTKTTSTESKDGTAQRVTLRSSRDMMNYIDSLDI